MKSTPLPHHILPLATSPISPNFRLVLNDKERALCADQKGFLEHLKTRSLIISTLRISLLQGSQILTGYFTDQLTFESSLDEDLISGKITRLEFDIKTQQWEEKEWKARTHDLVPRVKKALMKYHILMICMRTYEKCFEWFVSKKMMDRLTKDSFKSAIRKQQRVNDGEILLDKNGNRVTYAKAMFETCVYSNFIAFLSDYTVQQVIICFGYYQYIQRKRQQARLDNVATEDLMLNDDMYYSNMPPSDLVPVDDENDPTTTDDEKKKESESKQFAISSGENNGGVMLSFLFKSCRLIVTKSLGLFMAGVGGSMGSLLRPGWGTLFGSQLGDTFVSVMVED
jgi:hypothetical protein